MLNAGRTATKHDAQSPFRVVEQATGREVGWINRFLDREYARRLADNTLSSRSGKDDRLIMRQAPTVVMVSLSG